MTLTSHSHPGLLALAMEVTYDSGTLRPESRQCQSRASLLGRHVVKGEHPARLLASADVNSYGTLAGCFEARRASKVDL